MLKLFLLVCFSVGGLVNSIPLDESVIEGHIVGGNDTDISQVPYQVAVYALGHQVCGGFIVAPTYVVTAVQCIGMLESSNFMIRAGSTSSKKGGVTANVKKYHFHPKYDFWDDDYDVAVLELDTPLKLNDKTIKSIKLATKEPSTGSLALVSGWGTTDDEDEPTETLQSVMLPMYDRTKCEAFYKPYNITITPRMTCAGGNGKLTDLGDNGGPLVFKNEIVGMVSFRFGFGEKRRPIVFTNMAHPEIAKFIKEIAKL